MPVKTIESFSYFGILGDPPCDDRDFKSFSIKQNGEIGCPDITSEQDTISFPAELGGVTLVFEVV